MYESYKNMPKKEKYIKKDDNDRKETNIKKEDIAKKEKRILYKEKKDEGIEDRKNKQEITANIITSNILAKVKQLPAQLKETTFYNSFKLFISAPKNILFMFLVDFIFLAVIMLVNGAFNYMFTKISVASSLMLLIIIPVAIINLIILILIYTFVKKKMLDIMFSYKNKISFETQYLKKFYFTNLIVYFIVFLINVILSSALTYMIKPEYKKTALIASFVVVFIFAYIFINLLHLFFCLKKEITPSFMMTWNAMSKLYAYKPLIISLIIFLIYGGIISLIGVGFTFIVFKLGQNMDLMKIVSISLFVLSGLVAYLLVMFNRIYYMEIVEKENE